MLGVWPLLWRDPCQFLVDAREKYGDVLYLGKTLSQPFYLLAHPQHIKYVLQENHRNYSFGMDFKEGQFTLSRDADEKQVEEWLQSRRVRQPAFHQQRINAMGESIVAATQSFLAQWLPLAQQGTRLNVVPEMKRLSLLLSGELLYGANFEPLLTAVAPAMPIIIKYVSRRGMLLASGVPHWVPIGGDKAYQTALASVYHAIEQAIEQHQQNSNDLMSLIANAYEERFGEVMTAVQLRDELLTLIFASYEATGDSLVWAFYLLSQYPAMKQQIKEEIQAMLGQRPCTFEDLPNLTYTKYFVREVLRYYPPTLFIVRRALQDDNIGGYTIPRNALLLISAYVTHRHPEFWPEPDLFDPLRFTPENSVDRIPHSYIPFGAGAHVCLGMNLIYMELPLILASVLQKYDLALLPQKKIWPYPNLTLSPKHGLWMKLVLASQK